MDTRIRRPTERRHRKHPNRPFRYNRILQIAVLGRHKGALGAALDGLQSPFWPLLRI